MAVMYNGVIRPETPEEVAEMERLAAMPAPEPTPTIDDLAEMLKILGG